MQKGLSLTKSKLAILSVAIALALTAPASGCGWKGHTASRVQWWNTPWAIILTVPGIALATGLYIGGRALERPE